MPRMKRTAKSPPNDLQAACDISAIAQTSMLMLTTLVSLMSCERIRMKAPHPFAHGELLQSEILRVLQ